MNLKCGFKIVLRGEQGFIHGWECLKLMSCIRNMTLEMASEIILGDALCVGPHF